MNIKDSITPQSGPIDCLICRRPSEQTICDSCKVHIQEEAIMVSGAKGKRDVEICPYTSLRTQLYLEIRAA